MAGLGLMILLGASAGYAVIGASPFVLAAILGFGVSALLYLVTEDLLLEAHDTARHAADHGDLFRRLL